MNALKIEAIIFMETLLSAESFRNAWLALVSQTKPSLSTYLLNILIKVKFCDDERWQVIKKTKRERK